MGRGALKRAAGLLRQAARANRQANQQQLETRSLFNVTGQAAGRRLLHAAQRIAPAGAVIDAGGGLARLSTAPNRR
jgi:hypothetical protein